MTAQVHRRGGGSQRCTYAKCQDSTEAQIELGDEVDRYVILCLSLRVVAPQQLLSFFLGLVSSNTA